MAQVSSPHIWYPSGYPGTAYDLRKVISWNDVSTAPTTVQVRFMGDPVATLIFNKAAFEAAKQNSLDNSG
jgi:hypothetical protein